MTRVAHLLDTKGANVWSVTSDTSVFDAIKLMADKGVGALLVMDGGKLSGIISERDYARKVILAGRSSKETPVRDIMTADVVTVSPDRSVDDCMALMTAKRIRHLPVMDGDRIAGVVSIGDLVKSAMEDKEHLIQQLENYIRGH